jgi:2-iminoacetate synthase ThiH
LFQYKYVLYTFLQSEKDELARAPEKFEAELQRIREELAKANAKKKVKRQNTYSSNLTVPFPSYCLSFTYCVFCNDAVGPMASQLKLCNGDSIRNSPNLISKFS